MGLLGCAAHHGEATGGMALMLHLAADRLGGPGLAARHGTYVGAIKHDDRPARVRRRGLVRRVPDSRDLRRCLPVVRLELQGNGMGADARAIVVCRRGRQQAIQNAHPIPERGVRAQLGLQPLQLRRAAGGQ